MGTINGTSNTTMGIIDFFEHGFVELLVNDFSAHIELETKLQPSKNLNLYQAPLPDIGLSPFQVPDPNQLIRIVCLHSPPDTRYCRCRPNIQTKHNCWIPVGSRVRFHLWVRFQSEAPSAALQNLNWVWNDHDVLGIFHEISSQADTSQIGT